MRARLKTITGYGKGDVLSLDGYDLVNIGRTPDNTIQVRERDVSRRHCRIERFGAVWRIVDAGSRNGTLLNGQETHTAILKLGDHVQVGHTTFEIELLPGTPNPADLQNASSVDETADSSAMFPSDATTGSRLSTVPTPEPRPVFSWINPVVLFILSFILTVGIGMAVMAVMAARGDGNHEPPQAEDTILSLDED